MILNLKLIMTDVDYPGEVPRATSISLLCAGLGLFCNTKYSNKEDRITLRIR